MASHTEQPADAVTTLTSGGTSVRLYLPDQEDHIQKTIRRTQAFYEADMLEQIHERAIPDTVAIDVGANIGNHTVFLAAVCGLRVEAFEPSPRLFAILQRNVTLNDLTDRVTLHRCAAGSIAGRGRLVAGPEANLGQTRVQPGPAGEVDIVPLDSLEIVGTVSVLKIDVEGMELEVLRGAANLIRRHRPTIYVEAQDDESRTALAAFLGQFGYCNLAEFNWTPTFLFAPCESADEKLGAILGQLSRMERLLLREREESHKWKQIAEEMQFKRAQLLADLDRASKAGDDLRERNKTLREDVRRWEATAHEMQDKRQSLLEDVQRLQGKQVEVETELDRVQRELEDARRRLEQQRQRCETLESHVAHLQEELRSRESLVDDLTAQCTYQQEQVTQARQELQQATVAANKLRTTNDRLRKELSELSAAKSRAEQELRGLLQSPKYRFGEAVARWTKPVRRPREWLAERGRRSRTSDDRAPAPTQMSQAEVARRHERLMRDYRRFADMVAGGDFGHVVVMFGGTAAIQRIRANRPIRLTLALEEMGIPVLFNFHRWKQTEPIPDYDGGLVLQSPTDRTPGLVERLAATDLRGTRGVLIISYPHPSACRMINLANANGWATLYDCRDDWEEFAHVGMAKWFRSAVEKYVVNNCDLTCCVSRPLAEKMRGYGSERPVYVSPNAYDPQFLSPGYRRQLDGQVRIGYFGHLTDRWFDWESLIWIMRRRPNYQFELIGHGAPENLTLPDNARLLGPRSHPEICEFASRWHAGIIPFRISRLADGVDPIKIYEYFGLGLPVVGFRMPQIADYPCTSTVDSREAFLGALDDAVRNQPEPEVLRRFIREHTWTNRAIQMLAWADSVLRNPGVEKSFHLVESGQTV